MKLLIVVQLLFLRLVCMFLGRARSGRLLRKITRRALEKKFGNSLDCESLAATWIKSAVGLQTFIWTWQPGQFFRVVVVKCLFCRWLGMDLARFICEADKEWFDEYGVEIEKLNTLAIDGKPCNIRFAFRDGEGRTGSQ